MLKQEIVHIPVAELILWSENPRDAISVHTSNDEIISRALRDKDNKWNLRKLAREMGDYYDYSELPIVVKHGEKYVVYDGNRRVALAKMALGCYLGTEPHSFKTPKVDPEMPCCLADKETAIKSVFRKHADSGSWDYLSREVFLSKYMKKEKSVILHIDDLLRGRISGSKNLNRRFVGEEVITNARLKPLGIQVNNGKIVSRHTYDETVKIINNVLNLVESGDLSTRNNRAEPLLEVLPKECVDVIKADGSNPQIEVSKPTPSTSSLPQYTSSSVVQQTRRVRAKGPEIFGKKLFLAPGVVSNLYRDIVDLYNFYMKNRERLSDGFAALVRMSLRLICEQAAEVGNSKDMASFVKPKFAAAKAKLSADEKTLLSSNNVTEESIVMLLHIGAHNYSASANIDQTIAMSIIIGEILQQWCGKNKQT